MNLTGVPTKLAYASSSASTDIEISQIFQGTFQWNFLSKHTKRQVNGIKKVNDTPGAHFFIWDLGVSGGIKNRFSNWSSIAFHLPLMGQGGACDADLLWQLNVMSQGGEVSCLKDWLSNSMNSYPDIHGEDGFHRARISFGASWKLSRTFSNNFSVKVVLIIDLLDFKNLMSSTKSKSAN